ncbi:mitomycin biosynthesis 6-O-methyltransferase [Streptomyces platensis]|uniref:Multifunctional cyclase-dehydratase-3-O-methyl transferase TcmN n=2 Tax=Streptomyces platensis TaxID=58346 RepID=A0ABX3Y6V3_STRPT|nr:Multifunctional cyclase-dehydratase-3-O-methyl transferase TcmN [Streptomyces platensis]
MTSTARMSGATDTPGTPGTSGAAGTPGTVLPPAVMQLRELALSAACAAAVRAAARLGVADALGDEPATAQALAATVDADAHALARLLRALAAHGIFAELPDGRFRHTETSRLLREDAPRSLRYSALWATEPWTWALWPHLEEAVRTGKEVFAGLYGSEFFSWLHTEEARESSEVFDKAMTQSSILSARAIAEVVTIDGAREIVDIAGGQGMVLATLLEKHLGLRGTLFDLPEVVADADPRLRDGGSLAGRARLVPGDCRRTVPEGADLYLLKNILEWDDESTVRTLRNVAEAAPAGARVVVMENLVDGSPEARFTTAMDLMLLLNVGGRKHTKAGLSALIQEAGLQLESVRPVNSYLHLFESRVQA